MDKITHIALIYSTGEGHTRHIADHIATFLKEKGHRIDLFDAKEVPEDFNPGEFDGVILGSSVHAGQFGRAMKKFVKANRDALMMVPSSFFSVSLTAKEESEEARDQLQSYIDHFIEETNWYPALYASFAGAMPFSRYGFIKRMLMRTLGRRVEGDKDFDTSRDYEYTDWASVEEFTEQFLKAIGDMRGREDASASPFAKGP